MYDIVYVSESNVVLGTSNSYPQVKVFGVLVEEVHFFMINIIIMHVTKICLFFLQPMVPEGHCLPTQGKLLLS